MADEWHNAEAVLFSNHPELSIWRLLKNIVAQFHLNQNIPELGGSRSHIGIASPNIDSKINSTMHTCWNKGSKPESRGLNR